MESWVGLDTLSLKCQLDTVLKVTCQPREMWSRRLGERLLREAHVGAIGTEGGWHRRSGCLRAPTEDNEERERGQGLFSWQIVGISRKSNKTGITGKPGLMGRRMTRTSTGGGGEESSLASEPHSWWAQPSCCSTTHMKQLPPCRPVSSPWDWTSFPPLFRSLLFPWLCFFTISLGRNLLGLNPAFPAKYNLHFSAPFSTSLQCPLCTWFSGNNFTSIQESTNKYEMLFFN